MNRRDFLKRLSVALAAANLPDISPAFGETFPEEILPNTTFPLEPGSSEYRIVFPDGTVFRFQGIIVARTQEVSVDNLLEVTLEIQPTGVPELTTLKDEAMAQEQEPDPSVPEQPVPTGGTVLHTVSPDGSLSNPVEIKDIEMLSMAQEIQTTSHHGRDEEYVVGIRRAGTFTIRGNFT